MPTFADRLRAVRQAAGLTQAEVAERAGLTIPNWSAYETGRRGNPSLATMAVMAKALGVEVAALLDGVDEYPGD